MRRPSPLPPPPEKSAERDESAELPIAPVVPLPRPDDTRSLPAEEPVAPEETADAPVAPEEEQAFGIRDVWRAARARRRALRAEVRRFTVRQRRRRMLWIAAIAGAVLLVAGTVGVAYSPIFAVRTITVVGTSQLDPATVEGALDGQLGAPLALVDSSAVKAALVQFPLVESYTLEARPPNDLLVRIVERTPIGAVEGPAGFTVLDAAGVQLSTTPDAPAGLPLLDIRGGTGSPAFEAAGQVMRSLPQDIRAQVTTVTASTADDVTLTLGATNTRVVWGSADESARKALNLATIMAQRPPDQVSVYDVSAPGAIVVG